MCRFISLVLILTFLGHAKAQEFYFPPISGNEWQTQDLEDLGWCSEEVPALLDFLDDSNTKAFILLKDGKIVLEEYFDGFHQDSIWYWASAGKSLMATIVGIAQTEGHLSLDDKISLHLGENWTSCTPEKEALITIRNQLTMSSGLDDTNGDVDCTDPECLIYKSDASTRWAYHNAPYTLLRNVLIEATGLPLYTYVSSRLTNRIGMNGAFITLGYNNVYFSDARSMARFGLLILNEGYWRSQAIIDDPTYVKQMVNTSQSINPSYGYLWWLNGKESFRLPGLQFDFPGSINPDAPVDMFAAMGKNGQLINVAPSEGLVMVRMGDNPDNSLVPASFNNTIWQYLNNIICTTTLVDDVEPSFDGKVVIFPNPARDFFFVKLENNYFDLQIFDAQGRQIFEKLRCHSSTRVSTSRMPKGIYHLLLVDDQQNTHLRKLLISGL